MKLMIALAGALFFATAAMADTPPPTATPAPQPKQPVCHFPATLQFNFPLPEVQTFAQVIAGQDYGHNEGNALTSDFNAQVQALTAKYCK